MLDLDQILTIERFSDGLPCKPEKFESFFLKTVTKKKFNTILFILFWNFTKF